MKTLLPILFISVLFAHLTERTTRGVYGDGTRQTRQNTLFYFIVQITLILPVGLRRIFNDTGAYIAGFNKSMTITELLRSGELHILQNPAFEIYTALVRTLTDNYHVYFMIAAIFVQCTMVWMIRRYSNHFALGIGLYIMLGTYVVVLAAMKQATAMAILMLAIPQLSKKNYGRFYLLVFVAFLFHTYAIAFAIMPLFANKPWTFRTVFLLMAVLLVIRNFESVIGTFLEYANESGKALAEYEVFDNASINPIRILVYSVNPLLCLAFRRYVLQGTYDETYNILINMNIISVAVMLIGTVSGANMFGRMGNYFEMGMVCSLPWVLSRIFDRRSTRFFGAVASICFFIYFVYAYYIALDFDAHYRGVTIFQFIASLF